MKHYIFMGALAACLLGSCGGHDGHDHEMEAEAKESNEGHADEIVLTMEKAQAAGVEVEDIQPGRFRSVITTSGQVLAAQGDEATVVAAVSGVVNFTRPLTEGTQISAGIALLTVSSQHIQEGDPVKRARIAYETAKSEYERAAKLVDKRIVSQKDFNQLKENYENARIAYEALSPSKDGKGVAVKSPIGGYVKSCLVKEGDYVTVGQPLLTVTQTRRLQLKAEVSERYYAALKSIVSANFTTTYDDKIYRLDDLKGRLLSYGKSSGDTSFYIPVIFEFDNRGDVIPGSFVEVYLLSEERQGVVSVPVSAITEEQGLNFVYLQVDAECYKKQEVKLGMNDGCRVEVLSGLKGGEKVVTVGAMHVKLAAAGNTIPGHTHNH